MVPLDSFHGEYHPAKGYMGPHSMDVFARPKTTAPLAVALGVCTMVLGACSRPAETTDMSIKQSGLSVTRQEWDRAASRTVFFGHQSVGENILDGLTKIGASQGWPVPTTIDAHGSSVPNGPALLHAKVGQNGDPFSKLEGFRAALDSGVGAQADIALVKFCFWDIQKETDIDAVFNAYQETMADIGRRFPHITLVHTTVPLVVEDNDWRARVRRLFGMSVSRDLENGAREELNKKMRTAYRGQLLFDIAALEQPDRVAGSEGVPHLASNLSSDGAHLNDAGRRHVAAGLVRVLSTAASRTIEVSAQ